MVDVSLDEMKRFVELYEQMKASASNTSALDKMKGALINMGPVIDSWKTKLLSGAAAVSTLSVVSNQVNFASFTSAISSVNNGLDSLLENVDLNTEKLKSLGVEIGAIYAIASGRLGLSEELIRMGNVADDSTARMSGMFDRLNNLAPELVNMLGPIGPMLRVAFSQVDAAKRMETSLLMNASAAGNLNAAYDVAGQRLEHLTDLSLEFSRMTTQIGTANNLTAGQVADYATQLMKIPGALGMVVETSDGSGASMNMLDATIRVASGTFQKFENVMSDVDLLFKNWNKTGRESLEFVARMHSAAQSLKMPMDIMREAVHGIANQFKFLGDNTGSAIDIMTRFGPSLQRSGLGPAAIRELVTNMTGAIAKMDVAQRGFVSARTGGPGGLQGGYQLALKMQEGGAGAVLNQVMDTMKGMFGGQIVTLKEAANDARAAAQFTKQVQLLTSGPMAIAGSEAEAFKLLEAMSTGTMPEGGMKTSPQEDLNAAMDRGNEIQTRQFNELVRINNQLEHYGVLASNILYSRQRDLIGPGMEDKRFMHVEEIRGEASREAAQIQFQKEIPVMGQKEEIDRFTDGVGESLNNIKEGVGDFVNGIIKPTSTETYGEEMTGLPGSRTRQDMQVVLDNEPQGMIPLEKRKAAPSGKENIIVLQIVSEEGIKKIVRFVLTEDNELRQLDEGKVAAGL